MGSDDTTRTHIPGIPATPTTPEDLDFSVGTKPVRPRRSPWTWAGAGVLGIVLVAVVGAILRGEGDSVPDGDAGAEMSPAGDPAPTVGDAIEHSEIVVRLLSVRRGTTELGKPVVHLRYSAKNTSESRRWYYKPGHYRVGLEDEHGNVYVPKSDHPDDFISSLDNPLDPGGRVADVVTFDPPLKVSGALFLTIPGELFNTRPNEEGRSVPDFFFVVEPSQIADE